MFDIVYAMDGYSHYRAFYSPAAWLCLLLPFFVGVTLDLYTKYMTEERLLVNRVVDDDGTVYLDTRVYQVIPDYLHLTYHENRGAVFGIGQGARTLFLLVSVMAVVLLGYLFIQSCQQRLYQFLLGMLLAGVVGNMYDRAMYGYVRDMIYIFPKAGIFPWIFNIADSLLCTGVAGMFILSAFRRTPLTNPSSVDSHVSESSRSDSSFH